MKYSSAMLFTLPFFLMSLAVPIPVAAEVYKWIDKDGKVHYSERKPGESGEKAVDIKISSPPAQTTRPTPTTTSGSAATPAPTQAAKGRGERDQTTSTAQPKSLSGGKIDESKESKCNLARDVLSGAVKHGNGAPTDAHDRQVAENDIRIFCK